MKLNERQQIFANVLSFTQIIKKKTHKVAIIINMLAL